MYIVYDQTWKRHLHYGRFDDDPAPALWQADEETPLSVFRTRKAAEKAVDATKNYFWVSEGWNSPETKHVPKWVKNSYIILPVKLERK